MVLNTMGWIEGVGYDVINLWTLPYCWIEHCWNMECTANLY
jgi:hypothetical protein